MLGISRFFDQLKQKLDHPLDSLAYLVKDIQKISLDPQQLQKHNHQQLVQENKQIHENGETLSEDLVKFENKIKKVKQPISIRYFLERSIQSISNKQQFAFNHLEENIQSSTFDLTTKSEPQINLQKPESQLMGEELEKLTKNINPISIPQSQQSFQQKQISPVKQVQKFCNQLKQSYFNEKVFTQASIMRLIHQIVETEKNNYYRCLQESFEIIKALHFKNDSKNIKKNSSNRNLQSGAEFNLELTMRSKLSRNSGLNLDRQDSLVYSNATSFGLNNTQHRSKEASRHNSATKLTKFHENEFDEIVHMEKTSSKGEVQNSQREFSVKSLSDTQKLIKHPPKNSSSKRSNQNSSSSRRTLSQKQVPFVQNNFVQHNEFKKSFIKEEHDYQILPLTQQKQSEINSYEKNQQSAHKALINTLEMENTPERPIKKSFSIKTYSNNKMSNSRTTQKGQGEPSVFSAEISQLESRISKIKETKLLKKLKLQEELKKVNKEIEELKLQEGREENPRQSHLKQKSSHASSKQKSAMQSRIKINDNLEEKKKAKNLVKNLRAEKISRQNQRRNQHKIIDADLHQQMEDMMRLKYFNEERVKQKRQLEIIERMKQQEVRKILEQKQKQQSIEFLTKLKNQDGPERSDSKVALGSNQRQKKLFESPVKKTEIKEIDEHLSNPALQKKKVYMNKMRNFTIVKKARQDLYEQALN